MAGRLEPPRGRPALAEAPLVVDRLTPQPGAFPVPVTGVVVRTAAKVGPVTRLGVGRGVAVPLARPRAVRHVHGPA